MCNCKEEIEERIKLEKDADNAFLEHSGNKSEVSFTPFTVDGRPSMHRRYTFVDWKYCPFCGEEK